MGIESVIIQEQLSYCGFSAARNQRSGEAERRSLELTEGTCNSERNGGCTNRELI